MLITMFSFMGAEIVTIPPRNPTRRKNILSAPPTRLSAYLYFLFVFYFCRCGINTVDMPGLKAVGSYRSVLELLNILMRN